MIMAGTPKKDPVLERKLKDIEREKRRVQEEIKALARAVKKGGAVSVPTGESRSMETRSTTLKPALAGGAAHASTAAPRKDTVRGDKRFANYFSTGGLKTPLTSRKGRAVERNKVIFICVVVALVVFILYSIFK
jgi:hypothetical protein